MNIVTPETRKKVLEAVDKLKYVPNMNAKFLKTNKKNTIGLFLPSVQGDFYKLLTQAIHLQCKLKGFLLNIYISNENTSEEIYSMIISSGVEGAIVLNELLSDEYIGRISMTKLPMVFIDREYANENMSSVIIDNAAGATLATDYLVHQGHRRIGYIHGINNYDDNIRFQSFCEVMNRYNLPIDENIILRGYFEEAIAYSEMRILLVKGIKMPDAFFCANDEMAWGCIRALNEAGIRVPEDISVMGFDDNTLASYYHPALTTIHSPVTELGYNSVSKLVDIIQSEEPVYGDVERLSPALVVRQSCKMKI